MNNNISEMSNGILLFVIYKIKCECLHLYTYTLGKKTVVRGPGRGLSIPIHAAEVICFKKTFVSKYIVSCHLFGYYLLVIV